MANMITDISLNNNSYQLSSGKMFGQLLMDNSTFIQQNQPSSTSKAIILDTEISSDILTKGFQLIVYLSLGHTADSLTLDIYNYGDTSEPIITAPVYSCVDGTVSSKYKFGEVILHLFYDSANNCFIVINKAFDPIQKYKQTTHTTTAVASLAANGYVNTSLTCTINENNGRNRYWPIMIAGWSSSTRSQIPYRMYFSTKDFNTCTIDLYIHNATTSALGSGASFSVYVLWELMSIRPESRIY